MGGQRLEDYAEKGLERWGARQPSLLLLLLLVFFFCARHVSPLPNRSWLCRCRRQPMTDEQPGPLAQEAGGLGQHLSVAGQRRPQPFPFPIGGDDKLVRAPSKE